MSDVGVKVEHISKVYKLYDKPMDRLKESLKLTRKKKYTEHHALSDINFEVKKGEAVGIIGTNGAGKSTILKIITGVLNPTEGEVTVNGRISALLELGAGFNMEYTGIENVYLNGTMIGFTREEIDERLQDILDFADIGDFVNQPVKTYSSGMFVRLAFAVAINIDPEILIVDEALSVGDVFFQAKCYHKFEEFKNQGKTLLFVSHDLSSISKYCDRAILLNKGRIIAEDEPKKVIDIYKKVLVNQFEVKPNVQTADETENAVSDIDEKDDLNTIDDTNAEESVMTSNESLNTKESIMNRIRNSNVLMKNKILLNSEINEYGTGEAEMYDFVVMDANGNFTNAIEKGTQFSIVVKVIMKQDIQDPIFAMAIKDLKGITVTGTNTMYEKLETGLVKAGEKRFITFTQNMDIQGGEYLLSLGCTGYRKGEFVVYHRLYDACNITVVSDKNTDGYYDCNSEVVVDSL